MTSTKECEDVYCGSETNMLAIPMPVMSPVRKFNTFSYINIEPIIKPLVDSEEAVSGLHFVPGLDFETERKLQQVQYFPSRMMLILHRL